MIQRIMWMQSGDCMAMCRDMYMCEMNMAYYAAAGNDRHFAIENHTSDREMCC